MEYTENEKKTWGAVYEKLMDEKNALLRGKGHAQMVVEELIGARLYTGPMFGSPLGGSNPWTAVSRAEQLLMRRSCDAEKYNAVLRLFTGPCQYSKEEMEAAKQSGTMCPPFLQQQCEKTHILPPQARHHCCRVCISRLRIP